jgi:hypothetical protein
MYIYTPIIYRWPVHHQDAAASEFDSTSTGDSCDRDGDIEYNIEGNEPRN